jgi:hypothetical protein
LFVRYYLFLPDGFPDYAREDDVKRMERLQRHPLIGVYDDERTAIAAYAEAKRAALERIRMNGRPNLSPSEVQRLMTVH